MTDAATQEWTYFDERTRQYVVIGELPGTALTSEAVRWAQEHSVKIEQLHRRATPVAATPDR